MQLDSRNAIVTLDLDWAPDWMIDDAARRLREAGVRATWFVTHMSPAVQRLLSDALFECGVHPNFLTKSSHGSTEAGVVEHVRKMVPKARCVRTHSLVTSEPLLAALTEKYSFDVDASLHLPCAANVAPHALRFSTRGSELIRVPHVFQDNMYSYLGLPWTIGAEWLAQPGLKVFDFHPVHLALNSSSMEGYERLKSRVSISAATRDDAAGSIGDGPGASTMFDEVLRSLSQQARTYTLSEFVDAWRRERAR